MVLHYSISPCAMWNVARRRGLAGLLRYGYGRKPIEYVQFFILRNNARLAFQTYQRAASHATCINKYWPKQGGKVLINIQKAAGSSVVDELSGRNSVFFAFHVSACQPAHYNRTRFNLHFHGMQKAVKRKAKGRLLLCIRRHLGTPMTAFCITKSSFS